jgi:cytochrome c-type biogenesis protein CcmH
MIALVVVCLLSQTVDSDGQTPRTRAPSVNEAEAMAIGSRLRCPVCQGMPISESPSDMAQAMMTRVREMLAEGQTRDQIVTYFTQRYGDWVLLDPRKSGINWLLWGLPPLVLVVGVYLVRRYADGKAPHVSAKTIPTMDDDPYLTAVRREVDQ